MVRLVFLFPGVFGKREKFRKKFEELQRRKCDARGMDMISPQPLQARPYGVGVGDDGVGVGVEAVNGGVEERSSAMVASGNSALTPRTSELTIAFEGEVYVFPAVTPEKVRLRFRSFDF